MTVKLIAVPAGGSLANRSVANRSVAGRSVAPAGDSLANRSVANRSVAGRSVAPAGDSLAGRSVSKPQHSPRHLCTAAIESAARGDVIVIEHSSGVECAGWGGVLSVGAQVNGVEGVVIDGPARDIDEARALGFPVYGRSPIARTARGRAYEIDFNCEIRIGEVRVVPGDVVFADSSGVVFLPAAQIEEIVRRAARIAERERLMVQALRAGNRITEVVGRNYEEMLTKLD
jgi:regulator of RNase E activity RraA